MYLHATLSTQFSRLCLNFSDVYSCFIYGVLYFAQCNFSEPKVFQKKNKTIKSDEKYPIMINAGSTGSSFKYGIKNSVDDYYFQIILVLLASNGTCFATFQMLKLFTSLPQFLIFIIMIKIFFSHEQHSEKRVLSSR